MKMTFEGYGDLGAGWDFMMPLVLVEPVMQMHDVGSIDDADGVIEGYIMEISLGETPTSDPALDRALVRRDFRSARKGSRRFCYFRQEVDIPDDIDWESVGEEDPFERIAFGELQIGAAALRAAGGA